MTLCSVCGLRPTEPSRGIHGPKPKYCAKCHREVLLERARRNASKLRQRPEWREYMQRYFQTHTYPKANPTPTQNWRSKLSHRYGLKPEHLQAWLDFQDGNCGLCGEPLGARFHVDHDHEAGVVRGLLHSRCNQQLQRLPNHERYLLGWVA